jgi:hypothetical protein
MLINRESGLITNYPAKMNPDPLKRRWQWIFEQFFFLAGLLAQTPA